MTKQERFIKSLEYRGKNYKWTEERKKKLEGWIKSHPVEDVSFDDGHPELKEMFPEATNNSVFSQWLRSRHKLGLMNTPRKTGIAFSTKKNGKLTIEINFNKLPISSSGMWKYIKMAHKLYLAEETNKLASVR